VFICLTNGAKISVKKRKKMGDVMGKLDKVAQQTQRQVTVDLARR